MDFDDFALNQSEDRAEIARDKRRQQMASRTIDGVTYTNTHSGQKKAYGDTYYEYDVTSDLPATDVERICRERVSKAISKAEWLADYRAPGGCSMDKAFRPHYTFTRKGDGRYCYSVCCLYTD